jgi:hypothetical protein
MYAEEKNAKGEVAERFLLSAKREKNDFYISPYELDEQVGQLGSIASRRCAVLKKCANARGENYRLYLAPRCASCQKKRRLPEALREASGLPGPGKEEGQEQPARCILEVFHSTEVLQRQQISMREVQVRIHSEDPGVDEVIRLKTRFPKWQAATNCLTQKFIKARIKASSAKNIILTEGGGDDAVFQFGKKASKVYAIDHSLPLVPLHALGIALSMCNWLGGE